MEPAVPERDRRLHAAMDAFVPLHGACAGHERMAIAAGNAVVAPRRDALAAVLGAARGLTGSRS